jgi:hypothetical protein
MLRKINRTQFLVALLAVSFGSNTKVSLVLAGDEVQLVGRQSRVISDCECGKWTCPSCQSRAICPPGYEGTQVPQPIPMNQDGSAGSGAGSPSVASPSDNSGINMNNGIFGAVPGAENVPGAQPVAPGNANQNLSNLLAMSSSAGAGFGGSNSSSMLGGETPEFMGDFYGPEALNVQEITDGSSTYLVPRSVMLTPGGRLGRQKLTENNSPIPQDRVFFNYSHFSNVPLTLNGVDVDRYTPGFEKTFLGGLASVEFRSPIGTTSSDTFDQAGNPQQTRDSQFGNLYVGVKGILMGNDRWVLTSGLSVLTPTAEDSRQVDSFGNVTGKIDNGSVHLMPFLGGAIRHSSRHFSQWMVQVDVDATGSDVIAFDGQGNSRTVGTVQQQNLIYVDLNSGYWLYRAPSFQRYGLTGIAWLNEFHLNQSINNGDTFGTSLGQISGGVGSFQNINVLTGLSFEMNRASRLGVGYAIPLGNGADNPFSNELRVTFNRYF